MRLFVAKVDQSKANEGMAAYQNTLLLKRIP